MPSLFLYGTLKTGGTNHRLLVGQRRVGTGLTRPLFRLYELDGYPGMVEAGDCGQSIEGEIWEVDLRCLAELDDFEGVSAGLYAREPIALLPPQQDIPVQAYLYRGSIEGRRELGTRYA